ncbi:hypothetical protein BAMY6639_03730 [Bacillus sp. CN2]|nr:hypothetical protein BAMY6639_03730 [Bacillus amyloliquefaciens UMAF6639]ANF37411.1 hypothetical protein BCBMB205_25170 [Bacillus velezensis]ARZ58859.1 hypothetical protein BAGQ_2627 [Bacillus velezensis]GFR55861.1 hypothetical protein BAMY6639_03730 [Bacillus sp. CN2]
MDKYKDRILTIYEGSSFFLKCDKIVADISFHKLLRFT